MLDENSWNRETVLITGVLLGVFGNIIATWMWQESSPFDKTIILWIALLTVFIIVIIEFKKAWKISNK